MSDQVMNSLGMSDEEFLKLDPSQFDVVTEALEEQEVPTEETEVDEEVTSQSVPQEEAPATETGEVSEQSEAEEVEDEGQETPDESATPADPQAKTDAPDAAATESPVDYKGEYERLLAPFKANGRDVTVKSVDDAIALMQMGVNYNKKMAGMKPHLKVLKTLENHGLLDEKELGFLIDLKQRKPEAINKLVKDSGIDPMDLDADKADAYVPQTYSVDDREIEVDQIVEEIKDSPSFNRTVELISSKLDAKSRQAIADHPQGIRILHDHIERGIYDQIMGEVENERMFGRLQGLSDLEAYRQVGDAIQARGGFDHLGRQGQQTPAPQQIVVPNPKKEDDGKLREKRRAASPTKPGTPGGAKQEFNPLAMSDEEFEKAVIPQFL